MFIIGSFLFQVILLLRDVTGVQAPVEENYL